MTQAETMASVAVTIPKITVENGKKKNNDLTIKNPHHKPPALCDTALRPIYACRKHLQQKRLCPIYSNCKTGI